MWIWWLISLLVLIACFIFAYKMIVSSYEYLPAEKRNLFTFRKNNGTSKDKRADVIYELKSHIKKMQENASIYEMHFSKLQQRLKALEENEKKQAAAAAEISEPAEDWKEMYYEENEAKEKLENELDLTTQKLEETQKALSALQANKSNLSSLQSDYDARLNELESRQEHIDLLQRQLEAATERENDLQQSLLREINARKQLESVVSENARLRSQNDDLKSQLLEVDRREKDLRQRLPRVNELESTVAMYEEEKAKMIANLEKMVNQNKLFSAPNHSS